MILMLEHFVKIFIQKFDPIDISVLPNSNLKNYFLKNFGLRTQLEWVSVEMKNFPNSFLNKQWQRRRLGISNFLNPHKFGILQSLEILKATVKYDLRSRNLNAILSITFYLRLPQQFFRAPVSPGRDSTE